MSEAKPAPATSHAHSVEPVKEGKLSDSSRTLNDQFAKAKAAQLQKQAAAKEQPANSNLSHARTMQMDGKENKLDRASQNMGSQFDRAKAAQLAKAQEAPSIKAPAPTAQMHLKPGGELQKEVDRPIHQKEMSAYAKQAKELNDSVKARHANQNQADKKNEKGKDLDRGR